MSTLHVIFIAVVVCLTVGSLAVIIAGWLCKLAWRKAGRDAARDRAREAERSDA